MREISVEERVFFAGREGAFPLYEALAKQVFDRFGETGLRVQKTQITYVNPRVFLCVSFTKVRRAKDRPKDFITVTFGLGYPLGAPRVDAAVEVRPGRWTHHVTVGAAGEIDGQLMGWIEESYHFARAKK